MNVTAEMIWSFVLAATSAFLLISNALEKIVKAYKTAKGPNIKLDERLSVFLQKLSERRCYTVDVLYNS